MTSWNKQRQEQRQGPIQRFWLRQNDDFWGLRQNDDKNKQQPKQMRGSLHFALRAAVGMTGVKAWVNGDTPP
jgi:hypothetical protein